MLTRLASHPGLQEAPTTARPFFERAYETADGHVARVRFAPQQIDPIVGANLPLTPTAISVFVSASLVDGEGQVLTINGRGVVREPQSATHYFATDVVFDAEAWLDELAEVAVAELVRAYDGMIGAAMLILPPMPLPEPVVIVDPSGLRSDMTEVPPELSPAPAI